MPYINDRLDDSKEKQARSKYDKQKARISRFKFEPDDVMSILNQRIIGQQHVLDAIKDMLYVVKADFSEKYRPLSVMLFMGSTGVGKTETVRVLTESILGSADKLCRIDMNTLAQEHYSAAITGSPPGYVGSKEGQTLFDPGKIKGTFSEPGIVLFDEIEKADQSVVRSLMNVLDTGKLALSSGMSEIDFTNTLIFMTSNLGAKEQSKALNDYSRGWRALLKLKTPSQNKILDKALLGHFDPEFINRIDRILPFDPLNNKQLDALIEIELSKLNKRLKARNAHVSADPSARRYLSSSYDARYGARDIARQFRAELAPSLAQAMLLNPDKTEFKLTVESGRLKVLNELIES